MPNLLPDGVSNPSGDQGQISAFEEVRSGPANISPNKSYPEDKPNVGVTPGPPLTYSGGPHAGTDPTQARNY